MAELWVLRVRERTVIVEGNTDVKLFQFASRLEYDATGIDLLGPPMAVVSSGGGDLGNTRSDTRVGGLESYRSNLLTPE